MASELPAKEAPVSSRRAHGLCLLALTLVGVGLFWPHLSGAGTLIGDADRLNTYLNIRTFSADSLAESGRVPTWNDRMFHGFGTSGLHWLLPEADPFAYLESLVAREHRFWVSGLISCLFFILAAWAMYALAYDACSAHFPAFVGAALYVLSSFAVNRMCQVDWCFAMLICLPLGLFIIRRLSVHNMASSYLGLTLLATFMVMMTFLQEVAYAFFLFGLFACYRSVKVRSWRPVIVVTVAIITASLFSFPRLYTVFEEVRCLDRTKTFQTTNWLEVLRWFHEGIFGRFPEEARRFDNGLNLHEGMQLHSSVFASLLVLAGVVRLRTWREALAGLLLYTTFALILWQAGPYVKLALMLLGFLAFIGLVRAWSLRHSPPGPEDSDVLFHLNFLTFAVAVILLTWVRLLIHVAFFSVDFTHSRIAVAALPSVSVLVAIFLKELLGRVRELSASSRRQWTRFGSAAVVSVALLLLMHRLSHYVCQALGGEHRVYVDHSMGVLSLECIKWVLAFVVFVALMVAFALCRRDSSGRRWLACTLGCLMVCSAFAAAQFQVSGRHTWSFPFAFKGNNYFMAPAGAMQLPSAAQKRQMQEHFESEQYRTAIVACPEKYYAFVEPHLSEFWGLRLTGGYSAGVPKRLAALPWSTNVRQLRSLNFATEADLSWPLLALQNTKYVVLLDDAFYHNLADHNNKEKPGAVAKPRTLTNPLPVMPRHFFTAAVRSVPSVEAVVAPAEAGKTMTADEAPPSLSVGATVRSDRAALIQWRYHRSDNINFLIERRDDPDETFRECATVSGAARTWLHPWLEPGREYTFRISVLHEPANAASKPAMVTVRVAAGDVTLPQELSVQRTTAGEALVTWKADSDLSYTVEQANGTTRTFAAVGSTQAGASSFKVVGLSEGPYGFRLQASGPRGVSGHSAPVWLAATGTFEDEVSKKLRAIFPEDVRQVSLVEGFAEEGAEITSFDNHGTIQATYEGDRITFDVTPSDHPRFLVLNELYHPRWRAFAGDQELQVYPTNVYMRGIVVPAGAAQVRLEYTPFLHSAAGVGIMCGAVLLIGLAWHMFRRRGAAPTAKASSEVHYVRTRVNSSCVTERGQLSIPGAEVRSD